MSAPRTFNPGDRVYSAAGEAALFVAPAHDGGFIVQPLVEDGDGHSEPVCEYADGAAVWPRVYGEPPRPMLDTEIAAAREKLAALRREIGVLETQKRLAEIGQREVMERLQQHEALQYLDGFLSAEITHYVTAVDGQILVLDAKAFKDARGFGYSERVLSLYATVRDRTKTLQWRVKDDSGYGGGREIWAFPDAEKARAKAVQIVVAQMREDLATLKGGGTVYRMQSVLENAKALGIEPLPELLAILRANELMAAQAKVAKAKADMEQAAQRIAALQQAGQGVPA